MKQIFNLLIIISFSISCATTKNSYINNVEKDDNGNLHLQINLSSDELFNYPSTIRISYYKERSDKNLILV
ncbi:hypothetical protein EHQ19_08495 [Leptospira montravelensis]|uniref:hypothetical protein n=1 Tax=Leptospira montravelensis TaxID=2484961 RepID=UPI001083B7CE|nr:hypothetical protein [Leptospira montravelensis]TGK82688.1 hypothetical protein EHQ19_08495 [Leptospira montravelensis]